MKRSQLLLTAIILLSSISPKRSVAKLDPNNPRNTEFLEKVAFYDYLHKFVGQRSGLTWVANHNGKNITEKWTDSLLSDECFSEKEKLNKKVLEETGKSLEDITQYIIKLDLPKYQEFYEGSARYHSKKYAPDLHITNEKSFGGKCDKELKGGSDILKHCSGKSTKGLGSAEAGWVMDSLCECIGFDETAPPPNTKQNIFVIEKGSMHLKSMGDKEGYNLTNKEQNIATMSFLTTISRGCIKDHFFTENETATNEAINKYTAILKDLIQPCEKDLRTLKKSGISRFDFKSYQNKNTEMSKLSKAISKMKDQFKKVETVCHKSNKKTDLVAEVFQRIQKPYKFLSPLCKQTLSRNKHINTKKMMKDIGVSSPSKIGIDDGEVFGTEQGYTEHILGLNEFKPVKFPKVGNSNFWRDKVDSYKAFDKKVTAFTKAANDPAFARVAWACLPGGVDLRDGQIVDIPGIGVDEEYIYKTCKDAKGWWWDDYPKQCEFYDLAEMNRDEWDGAKPFPVAKEAEDSNSSSKSE